MVLQWWKRPRWTAAIGGVLKKKSALRNFAKLTVKHLYQSVFFKNFIKKEALAQVFYSRFCKISKNTFFTKHLGDCFWNQKSNIIHWFLKNGATLKTECICCHKILEAKAFNLKGKTRLFWNIADLEFIEAVCS